MVTQTNNEIGLTLSIALRISHMLKFYWTKTAICVQLTTFFFSFVKRTSTVASVSAGAIPGIRMLRVYAARSPNSNGHFPVVKFLQTFPWAPTGNGYHEPLTWARTFAVTSVDATAALNVSSIAAGIFRITVHCVAVQLANEIFDGCGIPAPPDCAKKKIKLLFRLDSLSLMRSLTVCLNTHRTKMVMRRLRPARSGVSKQFWRTFRFAIICSARVLGI